MAARAQAGLAHRLEEGRAIDQNGSPGRAFDPPDIAARAKQTHASSTQKPARGGATGPSRQRQMLFAALLKELDIKLE